MYDILIIGAGITGAAIAMELARYRLKLGWLEKHNDVAIETPVPIPASSTPAMTPNREPTWRGSMSGVRNCTKPLRPC